MPRYPKRRMQRKKKRLGNKGGLTKYNKTKVGLYAPALGAIPRRFAKLRYESGNLGQTTTTTVVYNVFRLNSLYDPDYTNVGHQPRGFDNFAAMYSNYIVLGAKVEVFAQNLTPGTQSIVYIYPHESTSYAITSVEGMLETPSVTHCQFTSEKPCKFVRYLSCAKVACLSPSAYRGDVDNRAGVGANPSKDLRFDVGFININETTSTGHSVRVLITYYAEFFAPKLLAQS